MTATASGPTAVTLSRPAPTPLSRPAPTPLSTPAATPRRHVEHVMGTVFSIDVRAPGVDGATLRAAVDRLHRIDAVYSPYRPDSVVSRIADGRLARAAAPPEVREVLARCDDLTEATDGFFSACYDLRVDPSGYVKGWAIEAVSDLLEAAGSANHCVNGGGDVQCVGSAAPSVPWRIGIAHPLDRATLVDVVTGAGRLAVATSGTAERGAHILDPHTGRAPTGLASVTVVGANAALADAYATAAFAMGPAAETWLAARPQLAWIVVRSDATVRRSGTVTRSAGSPG